MTIPYEPGERLYADDFSDISRWYHEGTGNIEPLPDGGMRLRCLGSAQGQEGCQAFFRPDLPDCICVDYELTVCSQGGLVINFLAMRGTGGEDLIADRERLKPRTGKFGDYVSRQADLQSYHVSVSRFNDRGEHTGTSNWRRNPGLALVGHGEDLVREIGRPYRLRLVKDRVGLQLCVDGRFAHACIDRCVHPQGFPDTGKFGFRLIGSEVEAEVRDLRVYRIAPHGEITKSMHLAGSPEPA